MVNLIDGKVESSTSRGMQNVGAMMQVVCALPGLVSPGTLRGSPDSPIYIIAQILSMESTLLFSAYSFGFLFILLHINDIKRSRL